MDLDFKWGGNPSVIIAVETIVGAKFPVQVSHGYFLFIFVS